jgi:hypothetical protein
LNPPSALAHQNILATFWRSNHTPPRPPTKHSDKRYFFPQHPAHVIRVAWISSITPFPFANLFIAALRDLARLCLLQLQPYQHIHNMAEAAQAVPTFKLVLVGDGGTGKVRSIS